LRQQLKRLENCAHWDDGRPVMKSIVSQLGVGPWEIILLLLVLLVAVISIALILFFVTKAAKKADKKDQQSSAPPVIETKQDD